MIRDAAGAIAVIALLSACAVAPAPYASLERVHASLGPPPAESLLTVAEVDAPGGHIRTEVRSRSDGAVVFIQDYADGGGFAGAVIGGAPYSRSENGDWEPMAAETVVNLAGHEFHAMQLWPNRFWRDLAPAAPPSDAAHLCGAAPRCAAFAGVDPIGNPFWLFIDVPASRPSGVRVTDPSDPAKPIDVSFHDWVRRDGRSVFTRAIILDGPDVYHYRFTKIEFDRLGDDAFPSAGEVEPN